MISTALQRAILVSAIICATLFPPEFSSAQEPGQGDSYVVRTSYKTSNETEDRISSGSSSGHDSLFVRVLEVQSDGKEFVYDLPADASKQARAANWQFPARVFQPNHGPVKLLNEAELQDRLAGWLKAGGWDKSACGRWIFTWNAFRIECDPQAVLETIRGFDLRVEDLRAGATYVDSDALKPGIVSMDTSVSTKPTYQVEMMINPEKVRRARANSDTIVGQVTGRPISFDVAYRDRSKEEISGTISITFELDGAAVVQRRTRVVKMRVIAADGSVENQVSTEITERLSAP